MPLRITAAMAGQTGPGVGSAYMHALQQCPEKCRLERNCSSWECLVPSTHLCPALCSGQDPLHISYPSNSTV